MSVSEAFRGVVGRSVRVGGVGLDTMGSTWSPDAHMSQRLWRTVDSSASLVIWRRTLRQSRGRCGLWRLARRYRRTPALTTAWIPDRDYANRQLVPRSHER
jgi:hypothetical protein